MRTLIRGVGYLLTTAGVIGMLLVDIASSFWLYAAHGIGWVILSWVTWLPLLVLPFLAGYGFAFAAGVLLYFAGQVLASVPD